MPPLPENIAQIAAEIKEELGGTDFKCNYLIPLSGGNANYVFRGKLATPFGSESDATDEVLVKHGEAYLSRDLSFELPTSRCVRTNTYAFGITNLLLSQLLFGFGFY